MSKTYQAQRNDKMSRLQRALAGYELRPSQSLTPVLGADTITSYRRRAKLVVAASPDGRGVRVGLFRRNDNQNVVDIPGCKVLSPLLMELVANIRELAQAPPPELACLLAPQLAHDGHGALTGLDARELQPPPGSAGEQESAVVLLTLILAAERAAELDELREAARELRRRMPYIVGVAVSLRSLSRQQSSSEFASLSGQTECKDALGSGYQLVSHTSFLHVHRRQAETLYELLAKAAHEVTGGQKGKMLDLYGGTGAITLSLAQLGHETTLVESYPPAVSLASRAAQAQRLPVEVITGDVASVAKALASAGSKFDLVVANPPRRGLSPAAREAIAALKPQRAVYVACDLDNLSRDLDHLARLGYQLHSLQPLDMLPLTEEVEVVAVLEPAPVPVPVVLYDDEEILALDKPPHEPALDQAEYPGSLLARAKSYIVWDRWISVLKVEANTSGVCIFAKDQQVADRWQAAFKSTGRLVYLAAARGVTPAKGAITRELRDEGGSKPARTRYRRLAIGGGHSVLRVVPERRHVHQIRRHLAAIGHPVLGDARYGHGPTNRYFEEKHGLDRSFLHLVRVEVDHPATGKRLLIEAPLPPDLRSSLLRASDESVLRFLENKRALGSRGPRKARDGLPFSERSPLSLVGEAMSERSPATHRSYPFSQRGDRPIDYDDAPRTVRGELLTTSDDD